MSDQLFSDLENSLRFKLIRALLTQSKPNLVVINQMLSLFQEVIDADQLRYTAVVEWAESAAKFKRVTDDALIYPHINNERYEEMLTAFSEFVDRLGVLRDANSKASEIQLLNWQALTGLVTQDSGLTTHLRDVACHGLYLASEALTVRLSFFGLVMSSKAALIRLKAQPELYRHSNSWRAIDLERFILAPEENEMAYRGMLDRYSMEMEIINNMVSR